MESPQPWLKTFGQSRLNVRTHAFQASLPHSDPESDPATVSVAVACLAREADAVVALVSAGPVLLAACEALDKLDWCAGYGLSDDALTQLSDALDLAREAIAAAKLAGHDLVAV